MKDFVVKDVERFLAISDNISTPFKFIQVNESEEPNYLDVTAKVWLRTAYITYEVCVNKNELQAILAVLKRHGFCEAEIRETAITIR